jgi:hypothetical protein
MSRWLPTLVLVLGLGIATSAQAEGRVDWSQYLEPPGARPMPVRSTTTTTVAAADPPVAASRGKTAKVTKKKATKPKAKAKRKARAGKRR